MEESSRKFPLVLFEQRSSRVKSIRKLSNYIPGNENLEITIHKGPNVNTFIFRKSLRFTESDAVQSSRLMGRRFLHVYVDEILEWKQLKWIFFIMLNGNIKELEYVSISRKSLHLFSIESLILFIKSIVILLSLKKKFLTDHWTFTSINRLFRGM